MSGPARKIAFVLDTSLDPMDGVQQYVLRTAEWLISQGHEVHYLVGQTSERQLPNIHSLCRNVSVTFNGNKTTIPLWVSRRKVRKLLEQEQFDVLHVQTPHHPFMAQRIMTSASDTTAIVATFHILPYGRLARISNKLLGYTLRPSLRRIDTMLAVSSAAAEFEKWSFGRTATVLPNVFDYEQFRGAQPLPQYDDEILTILFLGRLVERKGCAYLLSAIALLDRSVLPAFRVIICGRGKLMDELKQFVAANDLSDVVAFTGFVSEEDKPRYYASSDISVFPSTGGESFGIVLLEAMASGRAAVLAGNNPGYATVMEPQPELLFTPQDITALAELLRSYITDAVRRRKVAAWGREYTQAFDVQVVGPKLVGVYEAAIAKRSTNSHNGVTS